MPPKKGEKGDKPKSKVKRPAWMSEELFELTQNLPKLQEFWSGDIKESKAKADAKPPPNITRTEVRAQSPACGRGGSSCSIAMSWPVDGDSA